MFSLGIDNFELLEEIGDKFTDLLQKDNSYRKSEPYFTQLFHLITQQEVPPVNISDMMLKIGKVYQNLGKMEDANNAYLK